MPNTQQLLARCDRRYYAARRRQTIKNYALVVGGVLVYALANGIINHIR